MKTASAAEARTTTHTRMRARVCRTGKSARKNFYCPPPRPPSPSPSQVRRGGGAGEGEADHADGRGEGNGR